MGQRIKLFERRRSHDLSNKCGIYAIYIDNHIYVGSSEDLSRRMTEHRLDIPKKNRGCRLLHELYKDYSKDDFYYEILEYCTSKERFSRERHYINLLKADCNTAKDPQHPIVYSRKVYQYDNRGNYIREYETVAAAARKVGGSGGNISNAAIQYRCAYNSLWSFIKKEHYPHIPKTKIKTKCVYMFKRESAQLLQEFQSIAATAKYLIATYNLSNDFDSLCSIISYYCKHPSKEYMGFLFSFKNNNPNNN